MMKTYSVKKADIERKWYLIDAEGVVLGRLAAEVAKILKGKNKPSYSTHLDVGDHVVVINAEKVVMTGNKPQKKIYYRHSGYPGGLRETPYEVLLKDKPELVVEKAVRGMLPKNRLGRSMLRKLHVHAGPDHPHKAQNPEKLQLEVRG
jgi:large subunit ribosomal protein L13